MGSQQREIGGRQGGQQAIASDRREANLRKSWRSFRPRLRPDLTESVAHAPVSVA
jgi:hypothetical protein